MAGILANSASKTMTSGSADNSVSGYLVGEQIVLTVTPTGTNYVWAIAKPSGSSTARSNLDATTGASVKFTPDAEGYFTVSCVVDSTTTYTLRIAAQAIGTVTYHSASNFSPLNNAQVPVPALGATLFYSSENGALSYKKGTVVYSLGASDIITPESVGTIGSGDDSATVQAAINAIHTAGGGTLFLTQLYSVKDLVTYGGVNIKGDGKHTGFTAVSGYTRIIGVNFGSGGTSDPGDNERGARWENFTIRGRSVADGFSEHVHNVVLSAASDFTLSRLWIEGNRGDGVYVGSSTTGGLERHNENIQIVNCTFDGLNNSGRNGLSVIDCNGLKVDRCEFYRTSTSGMPGAIDIEPDDAYNVVRDCVFTNCHFDDVIGNVGTLGFVFSRALEAYTTPPAGIIVEDCYFGPLITSPSLVAAISNAGDATASSSPLGLLVTGNAGYGCGSRAYNFSGLRGIQTDANTWIEMKGVGLLGYTYQVYDVTIGEGDTWRRCGKIDTSGLGVSNAVKVNIWGHFDDCGDPAGTFGYALDFSGGGDGTATSSYIDISRLRVTGSRTTVAIQKEAGHTFTANTNNAIGAQLSSASNFLAVYPGNAPWSMNNIRNVNAQWLTPSSGTTVDVSGKDQVSFENYASTTTVTDFTGGYDGQILLVKLSGFVTIKHDVLKIILQYGCDAPGNSNSFLILERRDSLWREISRNIPRRISTVYTFPANGNTTPDVNGYDNVDFSNVTSALSVTNFTNGAQGQEIRIRMDSDVTLVHGSGLALKGAVNVSGRSGGDWITLRLYGGTWEEVSRSW